ncbi:MAG: ribosome maturation factor RimP [Xanthomonadales bacterium]|nr:ribosome maturation factor RimP [Xanthomonadales bacterium]
MSNSRLNDLLGPLVGELGYEFVGLEMTSEPGNRILRVYIDTQSEAGLVINDIAKVSRELAAILDVEDPISGKYRLEVSSPGLDRPLFNSAQFKAVIGEKVRLSLYGPVAGRRKYVADLLSADDEGIELLYKTNTVTIAYTDIAKARIEPDFEKIMREAGSH